MTKKAAENFKLSDCAVFDNGIFKTADVELQNGTVIISDATGGGALTSDKKSKPLFVFPGFADVHVHLREPGFSYKETVKSGTASAARGGYVSVCPMPNLNPAPDSAETLGQQLSIIEKDALIHVLPYGTITASRQGQALSDMESMADRVAGFSDDGSGIQTEELMRKAMLKAKALGKIIVAHCEDMSLISKGGCIHDGEYARKNGFIGISSESEWKQVERDLKLVKETGCSYHVCHISTKESVELIRRAKAEGLDVTCETGPHYLTMTDMDLKDEGRFKMNPPLRSEEDKRALIEGLIDGTVDMIATDHAPHSAEEKSKGLAGSAMGVVGLETAFAVLYTDLVRTGIITLEKLVEVMSIAPANRFSLPVGYENGSMCVFELDTEYTVEPKDFVSMGKATPFEGKRVYGACMMTVYNGKVVYKKENQK
ncbi:MAG: dihydroorotase [Clostridia bacterium]|nr:dihydroorotase [Clostridia bacterium]